MKRLTVLAPRETSGELVEWLQRLGLVHVEDALGRLGEAGDLKRAALPTDRADDAVRQLELIAQVFDAYAPQKRSLAENFVTLPARVPQSELERIVAEFDPGPLFEECANISEQVQQHQKAIETGDAEMGVLEFFHTLPFGPEELRALREATAWVGTMEARPWDRLQADEEAREVLALQELTRENRSVRICAVALNADSEKAHRLLRKYQLAELKIPEFEGTLMDRLRELRADVERRREALKVLKARAVDLACSRAEVRALLGYWQAERARIQALNNTGNTDRISVLCGYIRARDVARFEEELAREFPGASALCEDPTPEDNVPVSLTHGPVVKPMRFLVDMFGLPDYFGFDPTPYLSLSFLVFFGMCFSDVVYGLLLCGVAWYLSRKSRGYETLNNMCRMFLYCGISTIIFGVLSGSWAANLPEYLGEGNVLLWIKQHTEVIDPIERAVFLLVVCLAIGVANQLYGIVLKGYGLLRRGDVAGAAFDAGLWLLMIPAFLTVISPMFFPTPPALVRVGIAVLVLAMVGLVLTQGRKEKGIVAKGATGLVSLYGIMGSYGCVSFVGDMLSYSRLLALGLTTAVVGMSFNVIADVARGVPYLGIGLFVLVLLVGHLFNFTVSILGAFVHPARLIFLEFFSRFYETGGTRFRPLSLSTDTVIVEHNA